MRWIREHKLISALLAILLALSIIFVVSLTGNGNDNVATDAVNKGTNTVSKGLSAVAGVIKKNVTGIFSYKKLQKEIEDLQEENTDLRRQLAEAKIEREQLDQLEELADVLNFDYTKKKFKLVSADVTSLDGSNWTNVFTINIGSESGVEVGDAVVNGMGLIGKIQDTGKGWSKVVSIIDDDSKVSFKLARDTKQLGVVKGNSLGEINGYMLDSESLVSQGDIIITSGLGTYPEGLEIGNVKDVAYNSNTLLKEITVEPAVNFKNLEKVSVIL